MDRKEFERVTPESVGIRSTDIASYIDALERSNTEMHGLMIMRGGKICCEGWWSPYAPGLRHGLQSHTKTYAATAVGIAVNEDIVRLDERLIDIFPDESPKEPGENLQLLTVRDVLCMGCGMDEMQRPSPDWIREFLHTPVNHKPGTTFMYNSNGSTMLGAIVRKKTGEGLHEYLTKRLFVKIGIDPDNIRWYHMPDGMEIGGGGMLATTEDNLRLMKLYADGGVWEGERILSAEYVKLATTLQNESATEAAVNPEASDNFLGYGFQIWMCKPEGVYRADGAMGQFTIVSPKQDLLIAITETAKGAHWAQNTLDITWEFLKAVTGSEALAEDTEAASALRRKTACLSVPAPLYRPVSPMTDRISGREYAVTSGLLSAGQFNFMSGARPDAIDRFSFVFDDYGCVWNIRSGEQEITVRIATYGGRMTNVMGKPGDVTRLLVCDGAWSKEDTFSVNLRWAETCLTKHIDFRFSGDTVEIEEENNSPFRMGEPEPIRASAI